MDRRCCSIASRIIPLRSAAKKHQTAAMAIGYAPVPRPASALEAAKLVVAEKHMSRQARPTLNR
jgi:hypothetical protein